MKFVEKNVAVNILCSFKQLNFIKDFLKESDEFRKREQEYFKAVEELKFFLENDLFKLKNDTKFIFKNEFKEDIANTKLYEINKDEMLKGITDYNVKMQDLLNKINSNVFLDDSHYESIGLSHWESPEIIDIKNIESYFDYLQNCILQFKDVADKWIKWFDAQAHTLVVEGEPKNFFSKYAGKIGEFIGGISKGWFGCWIGWNIYQWL